MTYLKDVLSTDLAYDTSTGLYGLSRTRRDQIDTFTVDFEDAQYYVTPQQFTTSTTWPLDSSGNPVDASPAIQAALDYAGAQTTGRPDVIIPAGTYYLSSTLSVPDSVTLSGAGNTQTGYQYNTVLAWNSTGGPIIKCWGREQVVENLSIYCASGKSSTKGIDITKGSGNNACTNVTLRNLFIRGTGRITYGVVIGDDYLGGTNYPQNCEYFEFDNVYFYDCITAGIYCPNTTGQAKNHVYRRCVFYGSPYGVYAARLGYKCEYTGFGYHTTAANYHSSSVDTHEFISCDVESCSRFYEQAGPSGAGQTVTFVGGRYDCSTGLNVDGKYFKFGTPGPYTMTGVLFSGAIPSAFNINFNTSRHAKLITTGCTFPNATNGYNTLVTGNYSEWTRQGCIWADSTGGSFPIPDMIGSVCGTVTTTDATVTTACSYRVAGVSTSQLFEATVAGNEAATGDSATYIYLVEVAVSAGDVVTIKGSPTAVHVREDQAAWAVTFAISSNVLLNCKVTGEAAKTIVWNAQLRSVQSHKTT